MRSCGSLGTIGHLLKSGPQSLAQAVHSLKVSSTGGVSQSYGSVRQRLNKSTATTFFFFKGPAVAAL